MRSGEFLADPHTAGSITLLFQASLPCCLLGQRTGLNPEVILKLRGGSNTKGAPPVDFIRLCLFPMLSLFFGVPSENLKVDVKKRGYYPLGGGDVDFSIVPVKSLEPIVLIDRGEPKEIIGTAFGGGTGKKIAKDVARLTKQKLSVLFPGIDINITVCDEPDGGEEKKMELSMASSAATTTTTTTTTSPKNTKQGKASARGRATASQQNSDDSATMTFKERRAMAEEKRRKNAGVSGCQVVLRTTTNAFITGDALVLEAGKTGTVTISPTEVSDIAVGRLREAWEVRSFFFFLRALFG